MVWEHNKVGELEFIQPNKEVLDIIKRIQDQQDIIIRTLVVYTSPKKEEGS